MARKKYSNILVSFLFIASFLSISAPVFAMDLTAHGYYRVRGEAFEELDMQKPRSDIAHDNHRFGLVAFNQMRLRVEPILKVNDFISVDTQMDILDNIVFGTQDTKQLQIDNPFVGTIDLPPGAGSISMVGGNAGENKVLNIRRAYMDILLPIGKLKIGRQPSHWGLGIFQNDGNERQGDFGDTADRVMFATQYDFDSASSLSGGLLWDIAFTAQYDPRIQGLAGAISNHGKDTQQYAAFLLYERPEVSVGMFGGIRRRSGGNDPTTTADDALCDPSNPSTAHCNIPAGIDGKTMIYFTDLYARYEYEEYTFKFEGVYIGGKMSTGVAIDAIPFSVYSGGKAGDGIIQLPPKQSVQVFEAAFEATGYYKWGGEWNFKSGFSEGDGSPLSQRITQYGFRPDYQIALLMFHEPLGTSPSMWGPNAYNGSTTKLGGGLPITGNFINNAIYVSGGYKHHFNMKDRVKECNDLAVGAKVVTAWADKNPVDLNFQTILNDPSLPVIANSAKWYGVEADVIAETKFYDHLYAALEGGVLIPGGAYNIKTTTLLIPGGDALMQTIPYSKASLSYGGRLTMMVDF